MSEATFNWRERLPELLRLYVLTDRGLSRGRSEREVVHAAIAGGATAIQLRWKNGSIREAVNVGRELKAICAQSNVLFVVNDRIDLALALDADCVHLGDEDLPLEDARRIVGDRMLIGYSPPTLDEAIDAERLGADYLGVGPVYGTTSKSDAGDAIGVDRIATVARALSIPIVGIGGITAGNAAAVVQAGASGVAVISSVVAADDVELAARNLRTAVDRARRTAG
jgi:thiamine-phosphate pyrophosphorylase